MSEQEVGFAPSHEKVPVITLTTDNPDETLEKAGKLVDELRDQTDTGIMRTLEKSGTGITLGQIPTVSETTKPSPTDITALRIDTVAEPEEEELT